MLTKCDVEREYQKELDRHRSQQVLIKALMEIKNDFGQSDPDITESINLTCLTNDLKMDQEDVDSLFGKCFFPLPYITDFVEESRSSFSEITITILNSNLESNYCFSVLLFNVSGKKHLANRDSANKNLSFLNQSDNYVTSLGKQH